MGLFTKDIKTMDDLLLHGLKDIYYAENQIVKSLPKLIEKATNRDLSKGLSDHLEETRNQIARLDQVFKKLGQEPQGVKCPAIDGLITEADELAGEVADKEVLDAAVVGAAQSVEHYEIARYGPWSPGPTSSAATTWCGCSRPISTRRRRPTGNCRRWRCARA